MEQVEKKELGVEQELLRVGSSAWIISECLLGCEIRYHRQNGHTLGHMLVL